MAAFLSRVLAPAAAELGVADNAGVRAVEEDILDIRSFEIGSLQDVLKIGRGETCGINCVPKEIGLMQTYPSP